MSTVRDMFSQSSPTHRVQGHDTSWTEIVGTRDGPTTVRVTSWPSSAPRLRSGRPPAMPCGDGRCREALLIRPAEVEGAQLRSTGL